jgi:hypothetical protein
MVRTLMATAFRTSAPALLLALVSGPALGQLYPVSQVQGNPFTGIAVAGLGDVDGDGTPDFAVGTLVFGSIAPNAFTGQVRIYSGASSLLLHTLNGTSPNDFFGHSLASLGDLDGDGVSDFLVGAPEGGIATCYPCGPGGGNPPVYGPGHAKVFRGRRRVFCSR